MNKKTLKVAPTLKRLTEDAIEGGEKQGGGSDPKHEQKKKRLSVDVPSSTHRRFKTVCSATNRKMAGEIQKFIERRTEELEAEVGISPMKQRH